jgi:predicted nucleotidyltransferase
VRLLQSGDETALFRVHRSAETTMDEQLLLAKLLQRLQLEFGNDLVGVLAGGSRMRGEGDPNSDIDVVVIIAAPRRRRWNILINGVEVEMFINPEFQMRRYFESERLSGRGQTPHLCATGRIVFDPQGTMAALQADARRVWQAGPPPLSERERWEFRYHTADALRDIDDVCPRDPEWAGYLADIVLSRLIHQHYRIAGRWLHKPKRTLVHLESWDPAAARLARLSCGGGSPIAERVQALRSLASHVLAPLQGMMPLEWGTEWEILKPDA